MHFFQSNYESEEEIEPIFIGPIIDAWIIREEKSSISTQKEPPHSSIKISQDVL